METPLARRAKNFFFDFLIELGRGGSPDAKSENGIANKASEVQKNYSQRFGPDGPNLRRAN